MRYATWAMGNYKSHRRHRMQKAQKNRAGTPEKRATSWTRVGASQPRLVGKYWPAQAEGLEQHRARKQKTNNKKPSKRAVSSLTHRAHGLGHQQPGVQPSLRGIGLHTTFAQTRASLSLPASLCGDDGRVGAEDEEEEAQSQQGQAAKSLVVHPGEVLPTSQKLQLPKCRHHKRDPSRGEGSDEVEDSLEAGHDHSNHNDDGDGCQGDSDVDPARHSAALPLHISILDTSTPQLSLGEAAELTNGVDVELEAGQHREHHSEQG
mmetsp:Transcript_68602/g.149902  ORF Transcript_68602/g.149902 Transcript_68602/m.149902 type:complete len:263 (-) Transcript_68602:1031-1819(-)